MTLDDLKRLSLAWEKIGTFELYGKVADMALPAQASTSPHAQFVEGLKNFVKLYELWEK